MMKIVRRLLLTITLLPPYLALPSAAFAQPWNYESGRGMPMMWGLWGIGMMFMHFVFWILLVVALVTGHSVVDPPGKRIQERFGFRYSASALCPGRDQQGRVRDQKARP